MTPAECVRLVAFLAARCPSMRLEESTPDAWYPDLERFPLADAIEIVRKITTERPYAALSDIVAGCKALRVDRLNAAAIPAPPAELTENPAEYAAWYRLALKAAADGEPLPAFPQLPSRPVQALTAGAFRAVPAK